MRPAKEMIDFFENIFNDEFLCAFTLASLFSYEELDFNEKKQQEAKQIADMILKHIDDITFPSEDRKIRVKLFLTESVPEILKECRK